MKKQDESHLQAQKNYIVRGGSLQSSNIMLILKEVLRKLKNQSLVFQPR